MRTVVRRVLVLVLVAIPCIAVAKPKVAIAPLDNDDSGKVTALVVELATLHAKVTSPKLTAKSMKALDSDLTIKASRKKLRTKLDVDAVIYGSVEDDNGKKKIILAVAGKTSGAVEVSTKSLIARTFKKQLGDELAKQIAATTGAGTADDDDDDADKPTTAKADDKPAKTDKTDKTDKTSKVAKTSADDGSSSKTTRSSKHASDGDSAPAADSSGSDDKPAHKQVASDDDGSNTVSASSGDHASREIVTDRNLVSQDGLFVGAGVGAMHRTMGYIVKPISGTVMEQAPLGVSTAAAAPELDAEIYPTQLGGKGNGGGFGFALSLRQAVGLSVTDPDNSAVTASVTEAQYAVGARYRFVFGQSSIAIGVDYVMQQDAVAKTSGIDMESTSYSALGGGVTARIGFGRKVAAFAMVDGLYALSTGMEQSLSATGAFGFAAVAGADFAFTNRYGMRVQVAYDLLSDSFNQAASSQASAQGVVSATDSQLAASALFAVLY
jgi:hypothetical protein